MCLHDAINNAAPIIRGETYRLVLYIQCLPRTVKSTHMIELEKFECVSYVMNIAPVLNIDREKMGTIGILLIIDDGVYVCICTVFSYVLKEYKQHSFVYYSHFQQKRRVNTVVQSLIIDHMHPSMDWRGNIEKTNMQ